MRVVSAGVAAFYLYLDAQPSAETSRHLRALHLALTPSPSQVRDIIIGYTSLLIEHDPAAKQTELIDWARERAEAQPDAPPAKHHEIPVAYGLEADVDDLSKRLGLSWDEIVSLHSGATYTVAFNGFTHGFPYLLGLPKALHLPRRETPRKHIAAGSVAIAVGQGGIYPVDSPGGWWVLGKTDFKLWDASRDVPTTLEPGDSVSFVPVDAIGEIVQPSSALEQEGALEVTQVWPKNVSLQGTAQWGLGRYSAPQGGVLDPLAAEFANTIIGNPRDAAVLEMLAQPITLKLREALTVCVTGGGLKLFIDTKEAVCWEAYKLERGALLELIPDKSVTGYTSYLAADGGFMLDKRFAPTYMEAGQTIALANLGASSPRPYRGRPHYPQRIRLRIHPGPQYNEEAFEKLLGSSFRVQVLNRMGVRLTGPPIILPDHDTPSEGSPWGAVQVPASGQPIILLSDRGRTGGYAKPAVCDVSDLWRLAQAGPGTEVWFVRADGETD